MPRLPQVVEAPVFDEFAERYVARVRQLKAGDPSDPDTFVGPVISRHQLDGLMERIQSARSRGLEPA
ncbi:MAG TPA: aldehyde dehydrogenase family protein [Gemmatirosa sp.]